MKLITLLLLALFITATSFAQENEEITLSTYFPAPYGEYESLNVFDPGSGTTFVTNVPGRLAVQRQINVGTILPEDDVAYSLEIAGPQRIQGAGNLLHNGPNIGFAPAGENRAAVGRIGLDHQNAKFLGFQSDAMADFPLRMELDDGQVLIGGLQDTLSPSTNSDLVVANALTVHATSANHRPKLWFADTRWTAGFAAADVFFIGIGEDGDLGLGGRDQNPAESFVALKINSGTAIPGDDPAVVDVLGRMRILASDQTGTGGIIFSDGVKLDPGVSFYGSDGVGGVGVWSYLTNGWVMQQHLVTKKATFYGEVQATSFTQASDVRLKDVHGGFNCGLNEVTKLNALRFNYKKDNSVGLSSENEYVGLSAQEVKEVIPQAVVDGPDGYLGIDNSTIMYTMLNAIKELKKENDALKERINALEAK